MTISDNSVDITPSKEGRGLRVVATLLLVLLVLATIWLFYEIGRIPIKVPWELTTISEQVDSNAHDVSALQPRVSANESDVTELGSLVTANGTDIVNLSAYLSQVAALAENANRYAHSHYSDLRLKTDIAPLADALDNVLDLNGISFRWDLQEYPDLHLSKRSQVGLIAQEVERVYPELVSTGPDGLKSVDYAKLTPILIEAIKEQQAQIERLEEQNEDLGARLSALESIVGAEDAQ